MPLPISVIIPTYNLAELLPECLESVLQQTQLPQEIIVVDDGSTDETSDVIRSYIPRVTYLRKPNGGVASARNLGILAATSKWIAFMDHDDLSLPTRFERQMQLIERTGCDLAFSDQTVFNADTNVKVSWFSKNGFQELLTRHSVLENPYEMLLRYGSFVSPSTVLVRRECLLETGSFDESLPPADDYDLFLRISRKFSFAVDLEPLVLRRVHGKNQSRNRSAMIESALRIYEKAELQSVESGVTEHNKWIAAHKARCYRQLASIQLAKGDRFAARRSWAQSERASFSCMVGIYWATTFLPEGLVRRLQGWRHAHIHTIHEVDGV
jgi:glycosyltransferase involved in cell wall biosynthesis